jgi:hypothetical protein
MTDHQVVDAMAACNTVTATVASRPGMSAFYA